MKISKFSVLALMLGLSTIVFAAQPITIAAVYSGSASQALAEKAGLQGAQLAVQEINAKGGVLGRPLNLVSYGDPSKLPQLVSSTDISIVIMLGNTASTEAHAPALLGAGKLVISASATRSKLSQKFPQRFFMVAAADNVEAASAAQYSVDQLHRNDAVVFFQTDRPYASELADYFAGAYQKMGGTVTSQQQFSGGVLNTEALEYLTKQRLSTIYLAADPDIVAKLITQIRQAKITTPIMGSSNYTDANLQSLSPKIADGLYYTTPTNFDPNFMEANMIAFVSAFQKKYGSRPLNVNAALAYDAVSIAALGIRNAKETDANAVATALQKTKNITLLIGDVDLNNSTPMRMVTVQKIISGKMKVAAVVIPQFVPAPEKLAPITQHDS